MTCILNLNEINGYENIAINESRNKLLINIYNPKTELLKFDSNGLMITSTIVKNHKNLQIPIIKELCTISLKNVEINSNNFESYFDKVPSNITIDQLTLIKEYVDRNINIRAGELQITAYNVINSDNNCLKITLLVVNKLNDVFKLPCVPINITDRNMHQVFKDFYNIDISVNPFKISIFDLLIRKEDLLTTEYDITNWNISFKI